MWLLTGYRLLRKHKEPNHNKSLLHVLERSESERMPNVHHIQEAYQTRILTHSDAALLHSEVIKAVTTWDEQYIRELFQFALGVRAGWKQSGLISDQEYRTMVDEISQAVCERLRIVLGKPKL